MRPLKVRQGATAGFVMTTVFTAIAWARTGDIGATLETLIVTLVSVVAAIALIVRLNRGRTQEHR